MVPHIPTDLLPTCPQPSCRRGGSFFFLVLLHLAVDAQVPQCPRSQVPIYMPLSHHFPNGPTHSHRSCSTEFLPFLLERLYVYKFHPITRYTKKNLGTLVPMSGPRYHFPNGFTCSHSAVIQDSQCLHRSCQGLIYVV